MVRAIYQDASAAADRRNSEVLWRIFEAEFSCFDLEVGHNDYACVCGRIPNIRLSNDYIFAPYIPVSEDFLRFVLPVIRKGLSYSAAPP